MQMRRVAGALTMVAVLGLATGCVIVAPVLEEPVVEQDYALEGTSNHVVPNLSEDPFPLFVGGRWVYRNAAADVNPEIHTAGVLENAICAVVDYYGRQCYVVESSFSAGPEELLYLHRRQNDVLLMGYRTGPAPGQFHDIALLPGITYLALPLHRGSVWEDALERTRIRVEVMWQEQVPVSSQICTLLGPYNSVFQYAWRVHYTLWGEIPSLYGASPQYVWFAPGIGAAKHVRSSVYYLLMEFRQPHEVLALDESTAVTLHTLPVGSVIAVQLRGADAKAPDGQYWAFDAASPDETGAEPVGLLTEAFYSDVGMPDPHSGTYAFQLKVQEKGSSRVRFVKRQIGGVETFEGFEFTVVGYEGRIPPSTRDLKVSDLSFATEAALGAEIPVRFTVKNQGNAETAPCTWELRWSSRSDSGSYTVLGTGELEPLSPEGGASIRTEVTIPGDAVAGQSYELGVYVDSKDVIDEPYDGDNFRSEPLKVYAVPMPDLIVTALGPPAQMDAAVGSTVSLRATVKNVGDAVAAPTVLSWYASDSPVARGLRVASTDVAEIDAGNQRYVITEIVREAEGTAYYFARVDDSSDAAESNETNNWSDYELAPGFIRVTWQSP